MGKRSSNPIDIHRRLERKREVKKNKAARIKARDAKVAQTRTIEEVKSEISSLERRRNFKSGHLDSTETRTLERLKKELRIVQTAHQEKQKELEKERERAALLEEPYENELTKKGKTKKNKELEKTAKLSIYYDEVLNPFGAPPPGKPMIYHKIGGGVTMVLSEALVSPDALHKHDEQKSSTESKMNETLDATKPLQPYGSDQPKNFYGMPPPPPPVDANHMPPHPSYPPPFSCSGQNSAIPPPPPLMQQNGGSFPPDSRYLPPPPLPPPPPPPPLPPPPCPTKAPNLPPPLPPPSSSVLRAIKKTRAKSGKKGSSLAFDVWASNEEISYEEQVSGISLEGDDDETNQKNVIGEKNLENPSNFHSFSNNNQYKLSKKVLSQKAKDHQSLDPCSISSEGYSEYRQIPLSDVNSRKKPHPNHVEAEKKCVPVNLECWFYRDNSENHNIQGPFSAIQMMQWKNAGFFPPDTPIRNGENGKFQPLQDVPFDEIVKSNTINPTNTHNQNDEHFQSNPIDEDEIQMNGIQDRIAALKQMKTPDQLSNQNDQQKNFSSMSTVEDRIKALRNERLSQEQAMSSNKGYDNEVSADRQIPITSGTNEGSSAAHVNDEVPYPTVYEQNVPPYNEGADDNDVSYPTFVPHSAENEEYPAIGAYPIEDDVDAYPVVGKYPADEEDHVYPNYFAPQSSSNENTSHSRDPFSGTGRTDINTQKPPKKQFKGDKSILKGLIPSHLQNRRSNLSNNGTAKKKRKLTNSKGVSEDTIRDEHIARKQTHHLNMNVKNEEMSDQKVQPQRKSIADDYDKFMEEIAALK